MPFFRDHDGGRIGIAGDDHRHDGGIDDAQLRQTMHPQPGVDHRHRALTHAASADRMQVGYAALARTGDHFLIGAHRDARRGFLDQQLCIACGWRTICRARRMP